MVGVRQLERAVKEQGFIGAHSYPIGSNCLPITRDIIRSTPNALSSTCRFNFRSANRISTTRAIPAAVWSPDRARFRRLRFSRVEADWHSHRHSLDRRDDRHGLEARQRLHRDGRAQSQILAAFVRPVHEQLRPGQGDLRHRLSHPSLSTHDRGNRSVEPEGVASYANCSRKTCGAFTGWATAHDEPRRRARPSRHARARPMRR